MAQWLDSTLDKANADIEVDMTGVGLVGEDGKEVKVLMARPISAAEYQVLKSDPQAQKLKGEDRTEYLGLRMTFEMLAKCDATLTWGSFQKLPLNMLGELAQAVIQSVGQPTESGGGVLGE